MTEHIHDTTERGKLSLELVDDFGDTVRVHSDEGYLRVSATTRLIDYVLLDEAQVLALYHRLGDWLMAQRRAADPQVTVDGDDLDRWVDDNRERLQGHEPAGVYVDEAQLTEVTFPPELRNLGERLRATFGELDGEDTALTPPCDDDCGPDLHVTDCSQDPRETITAEAERAVYGDRNEDYGHPREDFTRAAIIATGLLTHKLADGEHIEPEDIARIQVGVKLARDVHSPKRDNRVDIAGYALTLDRLETGR